MKTYCIVQNLVADSGHRIFIVKAQTKEEAVKRFKKKTNNPFIGILGLQVEEVVTDCQLVFDYANPNYEG